MVDAKKLAREPIFSVKSKRGKREITVNVTVPEPEEILTSPKNGHSGDDPVAPTTTRHTEIQHRLLTLGSEMGLDTWVANNDRLRTWQGQTLGSLPNIISELPTQFNDATQRTIELIDVLWLKGNSEVDPKFRTVC
ncbi:MAG: hypothetical protein HY098_02570 [Nitrospinae bacterium]|nr:hypothetical protein [Nitrospinota bacterium]